MGTNLFNEFVKNVSKVHPDINVDMLAKELSAAIDSFPSKPDDVTEERYELMCVKGICNILNEQKNTSTAIMGSLALDGILMKMHTPIASAYREETDELSREIGEKFIELKTVGMIPDPIEFTYGIFMSPSPLFYSNVNPHTGNVSPTIVHDTSDVVTHRMGIRTTVEENPQLLPAKCVGDWDLSKEFVLMHETRHWMQPISDLVRDDERAVMSYEEQFNWRGRKYAPNADLIHAIKAAVKAQPDRAKKNCLKTLYHSLTPAEVDANEYARRCVESRADGKIFRGDVPLVDFERIGWRTSAGRDGVTILEDHPAFYGIVGEPDPGDASRAWAPSPLATKDSIEEHLKFILSMLKGTLR